MRILREHCLDIFSRVPDMQTAWHMIPDSLVQFALGNMTIYYPQSKAGKKETDTLSCKPKCAGEIRPLGLARGREG